MIARIKLRHTDAALDCELSVGFTAPKNKRQMLDKLNAVLETELFQYSGWTGWDLLHLEDAFDTMKRTGLK